VATADTARLIAVISRGVRALTSSVTEGLGSLAELEDATTQADGAIARAGKTGKVTATQIAQWANEIETNVQAAFDDKAIVSATSTLIRYGDVTSRNIKPAMKVMTDLAAKTGSVESASTLLAKALADPTKAAGKLARAGVILTKKQQEQIKAFTEAGEKGKAQHVILAALAKVTRGDAANSAGKYRDTLNLMADASEDAKKALAEGFFPVIQRVSSKITELANDPATIQRLRDFGSTLAGAFDKAIDVAEGIDWKSMGDGLKVAYDWSSKLFGAFMSAPAEVKGLIIGLAGLTKLTGGAPIKFALDLGKDALSGVFGHFFERGSSPANPLFVTASGLGGAAGAAGAAGGGMSKLSKVFLGAEAIAGLAAVVATQQAVSAQNSAIAADIHSALNSGLAIKTPAELQTALDGVNQGIADISSNPLNVLVAGSALDELRAMRAAIVREQEADSLVDFRAGERETGTALADAVAKTKAATDTVGTKVDTSKDSIVQSQGKLDTSILAARDATREAKDRIASATTLGAIGTSAAARGAGNQVTGSVHSAAGSITSAIYGAQDTILVNNNINVSASGVTSAQTTVSRQSKPSSRSDDSRGGP
jgi:hypothetical protein